MMHLTIQQLVAQTDGELTGPSLTLVENHIAECETCWHEMERLAELDALLASIIAVDPGEAFFEDLAASVEAEISGKKKPTPRAAARHTPAAPPVPISIQRPGRAEAPPAFTAPIPEPEATLSPPAAPGPEVAPAIPYPELEAAAPVPAAPEPQAPAPAPAPEPEPIANLDAPAPAPPALPIEPVGGWTPPAPGAQSHMAVEHGGAWTAPTPPAEVPKPLTIEPVGGWTPPPPTPDDPFADLVLPPRSAVAPSKPAPKSPAAAPPMPPAPKPAPRPQAMTPPPMPPAPKPAIKPAPMAAPRPVPKPALAMPAPLVPPQPRVEPASPYEPRRQSLAVPILIGVLAFIAGLVVAVVVVIRLAGPSGILRARTEPSAPSTAPAASAPTPSPAQEPPAAPPAAIVKPRHEAPVIAPPLERPPAPAAPVVARPRKPAPPVATNPADDAALNAEPTVVIPVEKIRTETVAPVSPPAETPPPAAPAAPTQLGILCGMVLDSEGHSVARAQVMMADVGVVVLTDRAGRFCLTAPVGERTLSVVALGFTTARRLIALGKTTPEINIKLNSAAPFPTPH